MSSAGYKAKAAEANAALSASGNQVTDCKDHTFYAIFDRAIGSEDDILITVALDDKTYGIVSPTDSRKPEDFKLYFQLDDGKQIDFVDGAKKQSDEAAKRDMGSYDGSATLTVYRTDKQSGGTYPTGLVQLKQETIQITPSE